MSARAAPCFFPHIDASHLIIIRRSLHHLTDWIGLGLELGIDYSALESIDQKKGGDLEKCKTAMLHSWLKTGQATKSSLSAALTEMGEDSFAAKFQ